MNSGENKSDSLETSRFKEQCGSDFPVFCLFVWTYITQTWNTRSQQPENTKKYRPKK